MSFNDRKKETPLGKIPNGWKIKKVQELIDEEIISKPKDGNHGGSHPKSSDYVKKGIPFIMANDIINNTVDYNNCKYITKEQADNLRKGFATEGDVLITHKGTIGRTAILDKVKSEYVMLTPQVTYYRVKNKNRLNNVFLKYFFDYYQFQELLRNWSGSGSTRAYLGITAQRKLPVIIPTLEEQKRIANILYTLDKKIENNNKMNKTLEEMAQVIYKSWFVDFEPFQDGKFVESELGMIPNNIELKPLKDFFSVKTGKKNANIATDDGDYAFFTCSQGMRRTNVYSFDDTAILLAGNGDFNVKWYRGKFEAYQRTYVLIPNVTELFSFLYYSIDYFLDKLILGQRGSVISYLTKGMVEELKIPIMKDENMFNDIIKRLNNINYLIEKNENENRTLKKLRDSLLPKLMSGEIRVPLDDNAKEVN
jgi:type I restriction enzyme S subunit